jgi:arylsulfatase A-like enzyme
MPCLLFHPLDQNRPTPAPLRRPLRRTRLLVALFLSFVAAAPAAVDRPNILWIVMDDVGSEFPCYGERAIQTPHIDRLVREGAKFDRAFLTAPVCSTARSALITGMYQTTIGAHHHQSGRGQHKIPLPPGVEPVPAIFRRAGYYTCNGAYPAKGRSPGKTDYNFTWDTKIYDGSDWADRRPDQPFFAQLQLWGGKNRNDDGTWHREQAPRELGKLTPPESVQLPPYYPRDPLLLKDWAEYLDCLRYCDKLVGQILQRLEREGILDQTIVVLLGDNGISHARGKQFLYDEGIRTPFIVRGPGVARGAVRPDLIEHIDLAATSLAFAGLSVPDWMQGRDIFSRSYEPRAAVFGARDRCGETVDQIRSVRTEQYKYVRNFFPERPLLQPSTYKDGKEIIQRLRALHAAGSLNPLQEKLLFSPRRAPEELYDVHADPFETTNLAAEPQHHATLLALRARLKRWQRDTRDPGPELPEIYGQEMAYQISKTRAGPERESVERNVALMRAWAAERPLQAAP